MKLDIKKITYISILTCILCILSPISLYIGIVPITLSTFIIYIIGSITNPKDSLLICILYIFIGIIGIPVFSSFTSGIGAILGPTGGYIIGYIPCILLISVITKLNKKNILVYFSSITLGTIICYLIGSLWYMVYSDVKFAYALLICVVPFIIFDSVKIIVASLVSYLLNNKVSININ